MLKYLLLMSEIDANGLDQPPKHEPASIEGMKRVFEEWGEGPEKAFNDPKISAFGLASVELLTGNANFRGLVEDALAFRVERGPKHVLSDEVACNLLLRAIMFEKWKMVNNINNFKVEHFNKLESLNYDFLEGHDEPQAWVDTTLDIISSPRNDEDEEENEARDEEEQEIKDEANRLDDLAESLSMRIIQSNKPERYKGVKLAIDIFREALPNQLRIVEIGSSLGEGIKKIMWGLPFSDTKVKIAGGLDPGEDVVNKIKNSIDLPANIEYAINNDLFNFTNPVDMLWTFISSHYPKEFEDKHKVYEFLNVARSSFPNLGFVWGDASSDGFVENIKNETITLTEDNDAPETKKPNVGLLFTVMYECSQAEIKAFEEHLREILDPNVNSMVVMQDLIEPAPGNAFGVSLSDNFRIPGKYRLAVIFPFSADPSPIFLGEWDSARCNEFTMYPAAYEHYASAA